VGSTSLAGGTYIYARAENTPGSRTILNPHPPLVLRRSGGSISSDEESGAALLRNMASIVCLEDIKSERHGTPGLPYLVFDCAPHHFSMPVQTAIKSGTLQDQCRSKR